MEKQPNKEVKLRMPPELHGWYKQQAKSSDRSLNNLIIQALKQFKQQREL